MIELKEDQKVIIEDAIYKVEYVEPESELDPAFCLRLVRLIE